MVVKRVLQNGMKRLSQQGKIKSLRRFKKAINTRQASPQYEGEKLHGKDNTNHRSYRTMICMYQWYPHGKKIVLATV